MSPGWVVVTANAVNVRSGPSAQSSYAFGKLKQGDVIRLLQNEYGWARVQATGGAFSEMYAYVPADRRVALGADRATAKVNARTELRAPNADAGGAPDKSWKQIGHLDPGTTLAVLGIVDGEKDSVYKVRMPESAEGWVNMQFLRSATEAEVAAAAKAPATGATAPAATPAAPDAAPATVASRTNEPLTGEPVALSESATANAPAAGAEIAAAVQATGTDGATGSPAIPPLLGQRGTAETAPAAGNGTTTGEIIVERNGGSTRLTRTTVTRRTTLNDLEDQFKAVRAQPEAGAEFAALQAKYLELAATGELGSGTKAAASTRAQQLGLMIETQTQLQEITRLKSHVEKNTREISEAILDLQRRADYAAVGVLNASAVYDGQHLPELYRVCDPMTGATIAYVLPNPEIALSTMLGTLVGVKGGQEYDPALRLKVISPAMVTLLTDRNSPQVTRAEMTHPAGALATSVPAPVKAAGSPAKAPEAAPSSSPGTAPAPDAAPCPEGFEREVPPSTTP